MKEGRVDLCVDEADRKLLHEAVALHRDQLPGGFLTSLGPEFLELIFRNTLESPDGVLILAVSQGDDGTGEVEGFLLGSVDTGRLYRRFLVRHSWSAVLQLLPRLASFKVWKMAFETLLYPFRSDDSQGSTELPAAELLDMAVSDAMKGQGLAATLFENFVDVLRERGVEEVRITSGGGLERAHRFYEKQGASRVGEIDVHADRRTVAFVYEID